MLHGLLQHFLVGFHAVFFNVRFGGLGLGAIMAIFRAMAVLGIIKDMHTQLPPKIVLAHLISGIQKRQNFQRSIRQNPVKSRMHAELARRSLEGHLLDDSACMRILADASLEILPLLDAAYQVRKHYFGQAVCVHIINNAQNGHCPEDCRYCAQAKTSTADIEEYGMKSDEEMLQEARRGVCQGAACYCMVFAGRQASNSRVEHLKRIVSQIKSEFPDKEICVSTGFVSSEGALELKQAGLIVLTII